MRITTGKLCRKCGAAIPPDSPQHSCGACLLEEGLGPIEPEREVNADLASSPMLMDFGDYELLEQIGRGGQGVVFRARQKSLNRTVALKVITLGQWASKAHVKRFRQEAEAAASLEHPGIVPIHEVGERDGSCYFSMKFVEGGQLDEVARRAPMSIRQAVELITKIARTVHYAHEHGILHRDIKPGNILLDEKGEPHLTDFGLARLVETESTMTRTLDVLGTPSYMAPEQAVGNNAAVSSVTDVYGLGAVLYQLLTGQPPFAGGTTYETTKLLLNTEPRPPRQLNPKVDRDLSTICLKSLEKDPKRRYSSALALAEDLERWLKHEPISARHTGIAGRSTKWVRRNPTSALLAASLIALAAAGAWIVSKSELIRQPITNGIAVLPFENLSGDPDNAYFVDGIQESILTRLSSIADLKVISRTSTQHYKSAPENLPEIARQLGVAHILEGSVQKSGDAVRVNVQLIKAANDSHVWADSFDRKLTDIFSVESEVAIAIADKLQAHLTAREEQLIAAKPTNNAEAYDAYLRGLAFHVRGLGVPGGATDLILQATGFYERAVELDPNFALAWARLSRADGLLYVSRDSDPTLAARGEAAKRACETAQKLAPNSPETLLALGYYRYYALHDFGLAKATFESVSKMLPGSSEVPMALGLITRREGRWDKSIAYFEQALAVDPRNVDLLMRASATYGMVQQRLAQLKLVDRLLDITPNDPAVVAMKARTYQAQGELQEAAKLLSETDEKTPSGFMFATKINQLQLERNYGEAVRLLGARLTQEDDASYHVAIAFMQRFAGDTAGAKVTAEKARNLLEPLCKDRPDDWGLAELMSQAYAALGEKDLALKAAERAIMLLPTAKDAVNGPIMEENVALIQTILGENNSAISNLTRLLQMPYGLPRITPALLRLDPVWDPLRADPRFQKLCEEKHPVNLAPK